MTKIIVREVEKVKETRELSEVAQRELRWMARFSKDLYKQLLREGRLQEYLEDLDETLDKLEEMHMRNLEENLHKRAEAREITYKEMIKIIQSNSLTARGEIAEQIRPPLDDEAEDKIY